MLKKVKVGWEEYEVRIVKGAVINDADGEYSGRIKHGTKEILINETYPKKEQEQTLLHEIIHACSRYAGLDLSEDQVTGLSNMLFQVMKDNNYGQM